MTNINKVRTLVAGVAARSGGRFGRGSWLALGIAVLLLAYQIFPAIFTYTIPSDGWSLDTKTSVSGLSNFTFYFKTHLVDGPTPLRENDVLLAVNGRPTSELIARWTGFFPTRPATWVFGESVRYTIQRDGQTLNLDVPLVPLTAQGFLRHALEQWQNPWLTLFMVLFFLPAMVAIGVIVFFLRPRALASQALLIISVAFVGQVSFAPFETACLFYWPLAAPYGFLVERWTSIIIPTTLLLSLSFPSPKGLLKRNMGLSLALIYLPWVIGDWAIAIVKSGDLAGLWTTWIGLGLAQLSLLVIVAGSLIHSFRTVRGAVERAQLKWFIFGLLGFVVAGGLSWVVGSVFNLPAFNTLVNYFGYLFLPLCLGFAILRYRLFDIDLIIRRTVQYALFSGLLGLVYFGSVVLLRQVLGGLAGESSVVLVISTLLIAALFNPLRRQLQSTIDRRFYRQKYDATLALEAFSAAAREEVELEKLTGKLVAVVGENVQPESVSLWMRPQ